MTLRYQALACDYDGTLAHDGVVAAATVAALQKARNSGRRLLMVTGRELEQLLGLCSAVELFSWVVAENGGILYHPATKEVKTLAPPPSPAFLKRLEQDKVLPVSVGRVIVATWEPHQAAVLAAIRDLGLELQVIFNKGAVMILPSGVNKASGLAAALKELGLPAQAVVAVGDAENDHALLDMCGFSAAVANALPALKQRADLVTRGDHGAGVCELIAELIADDLARHESRRPRPGRLPSKTLP